jgi:WD40 repeat protein
MLALLVACASSSPRQSQSQGHDAATIVPLPQAYYLGVTWIDDSTLATAYSSSAAGPARLTTFTLDGSLQPVRTQRHPGCLATGYTSPLSVSPHEIDVVQECEVLDAHAFMKYTIARFDPTTRLWGGDLAKATPLWLTGIAVDPGSKQVIVSIGEELCTALFSYSQQGVRPLGLAVQGESGTWRVSDGYPPGGSDCSGARSWAPSFSPQGDRLAFLGSPQSIGVNGVARGDQPWNLYVADMANGVVSLDVLDLGNARGVAWSPDGSRIAFSATVPDRGEGVWLFDPVTKSLTRLSSISASDIAWSPDGSTLAFTHTLDSGVIQMLTVGPRPPEDSGRGSQVTRSVASPRELPEDL